MNIIARTLLEGILDGNTSVNNQYNNYLYEGYESDYDSLEYELMEDLDLYFAGVITEAMHPDLQGMSKESIDRIVGKHGFSGNTAGGGDMSKLHPKQMTAGMDMLNGAEFKEHRKNGVKHFAIKDSNGKHVASLHDNGSGWDIVHHNKAGGRVASVKYSEAKHHLNGALEQHAKDRGLDRKKGFSLHAIDLQSQAKSDIKQARRDRRDFKDGLENTANKVARKFFDSKSALGQGISNKDDIRASQLAHLNEKKHIPTYEAHHKKLKELTDNLTHPDTISNPDKLMKAHRELESHLNTMKNDTSNHISSLLNVHNQYGKNSGSETKNDSAEMKEKFTRAKERFASEYEDHKHYAKKSEETQRRAERAEKRGNAGTSMHKAMLNRQKEFRSYSNDSKTAAMSILSRYRA